MGFIVDYNGMVAPFHVDDIVAGYTGQPDTMNAGNNTAARTAAINAINTLINTLKAAHPGESDLLAELDQLKLDQAAAINANIPTQVSISKVEVLQAVKADMQATINTDRAYACARCKVGSDLVGNGRYPQGNDGEQPAEKLKVCRTCTGFGKVPTIELAQPKTIWNEPTE